MTFRILIGLALIGQIAYGQKPLVNLDTYKYWQQAVGGDLSPDGRFVVYTETNNPGLHKTLFIKSTTGKAIASVVDMSMPKFTRDSRYLIGMLPNDTLLIYNLKTNKKDIVIGVRSFTIGRWACRERLITVGEKGTLKILDYLGKQLFRADGLVNYKISENGDALVGFERDTMSKKMLVKWIDAGNGKQQLIYKGNFTTDVIFDRDASQVAFMDDQERGARIVYYRKGMKSAEMLYTSDSMALVTGEYWSFSADATRLFFSFKGHTAAKKKSINPDLEIWSYQDTYLYSYYNGSDFPKDSLAAKSYLATIDVNTRKVIQLTNGDQRIIEGTLDYKTDDYFIVESIGKVKSNKWQDGFGKSYQLCLSRSGDKIPIEENKSLPIHFWCISPKGKYIAYYDVTLKNYFCFDIKTRVKRNLTDSLSSSLFNYKALHYPRPYYEPVGIMGWLKNDDGIIIGTTYDIWLFDLTSKQKPINLTEGVGDKKKIVFTVVGRTSLSPIVLDENVLLGAFDTHTKDYGFYKVRVNGKKGLQRLSMGRRFIADVYGPVRKSNLNASKNGFLVRWEQSDKSANYYFSRNLKAFVKISNVRPELKWNWLTTELHTYKDSLGNELQGVLYKPENFDSSKKYPIIFNVYEVRSNQLNAFPSPGLRGTEFMLPLMVSNGYLVFMPDIRAVPKFGGDGAVRSVIAATDHLAQYKWVDTARMGISGHSVGGFVTNYTVTHTNKFKAAVSGAGISDMVRAATDLWGYGGAKQEFLKDAVYMMQADLPDDPQSYIRNSPILSSRNLTTPLLLLHCDNDGSVNFQQSRSFFIVLRSLQKPCWWLNYKGQTHGILGTEPQIDYNMKVIQFYDHFLKNKPMPDWMKEHI